MNTRPKTKAGHEANRGKVCAICGKKIAFGKSNPSKLLINEIQEELIRKYINDQFNLLDSKFPNATCTNCRISLNNLKNNKGKFCQNIPKCIDIILEKETRSRNNKICYCYICLTATSKIHKKVIKGNSTFRNSKVCKEKSTKAYKSCKQCSQKIGKGIRDV